MLTMMSSKKSRDSETEKYMSSEEQQAKINEVRKMMGSVANKLPDMCSDASISRYLRARNWNTTKASKMLMQTIKWRLEYRPDKIRWEDVAVEGETGKIYRANYFDKCGRAVLIMRPGFQNTKVVSGQIKYLVYCMENAISNLSPDQEQMVWLVDFNQWTSSSTSIKATRETTHILQNHYPERLGLGILYNPPKIFESFWKMVKPFIEPKTFKKVRFVYSDDPQSQKIMEEAFDMNELESAFGGRNSSGFDYAAYAQRMKEDDSKLSNLTTEDSSSQSHQLSTMCIAHQLDSSSSSDDMSSSNAVLLDDQAHECNGTHNDIASVEEIQISKPTSANGYY